VNGEFSIFDGGNVVVQEVHDLVGMLNDGTGVTGKEVLDLKYK